MVVEVLQEFTEFRYTSDLPANGQPGEVRFTYLPEGMEEQEREHNEIGFYVCFESADGDFMDLIQTVVSDGTSVSIGLDTENADVTYFAVHGCEAMKIVKGSGPHHTLDRGRFYLYTVRDCPNGRVGESRRGNSDRWVKSRPPESLAPQGFWAVFLLFKNF